jgi:hypothetical protein
MATPSVTGGSALILEQQATTGLVSGDTPLDSDSMKALLIHTARDLQVHFPAAGGNFMNLQSCGTGGLDCWPVPTIGGVADGPDYVTGWGLVDIQAAVQKVITGNPPVSVKPTGCMAPQNYTQLPFNFPIPPGSTPLVLGLENCLAKPFWDIAGTINVLPGSTQLKVTIAWDDRAATPPGVQSATALLVNDLDLILTRTGSQFWHYTWRLDPSCPYLAATRPTSSGPSPDAANLSDHRNNVEQVVVDNPAPGEWQIIVGSSGLAGTVQPFATVVSILPSCP